MKEHDHHNGVQNYRLLKYFTFALLAISPLAGLSEPIAIPEPPNQGVKLEEKDIKAREQLAEMIDKIIGDPEASERITQTGQERTIFCNVCHGKDGNSKRPGVPNLAAQNPVYLLDQIQRFADGRRYDRSMSSLAESFTEEEKIMLAIYYSKMEAKPSGIGDPEQWARGKKIYDIGCAQCHGENGRGEKGYARLASQKPDYVVKMLKEFKSYTGRRANPWMTVVSASLSDEEMAAVAAYVSTLQ